MLVDPDLRKDDAIAATVAAMDAGDGLILGGWLPDDAAGRRTGRPDLLIRVDGRYLPGDVKNHKTVQRAKKTAAVLSPLAHPASRRSVSALTTATSHRFEDGMQLAHYTRMVQACGCHPGDEMLFGAIIGTSEIPFTPDGHTRPVLSASRAAAGRRVFRRSGEPGERPSRGRRARGRSAPTVSASPSRSCVSTCT
jgi:hypothetical protein